MNLLGYQAMAVGNHEFDNGPAHLADFLDHVEIPVLSANIDTSAEPLLDGRLALYGDRRQRRTCWRDRLDHDRRADFVFSGANAQVQRLPKFARAGAG